MASFEGELELVHIPKNDAVAVSAFLRLGGNYLSDFKMPQAERESFLQSILARQDESDRWLLLLKHEGKHLGFVHMKIDKDERPGWGFILEFYIVPDKRRWGLGRKMFELVTEILKARHVKDVWLLTNSRTAQKFWRSLGFRETGEIDEETGQDIMAIAI